MLALTTIYFLILLEILGVMWMRLFKYINHSDVWYYRCLRRYWLMKLVKYPAVLGVLTLL